VALVVVKGLSFRFKFLIYLLVLGFRFTFWAYIFGLNFGFKFKFWDELLSLGFGFSFWVYVWFQVQVLGHVTRTLCESKYIVLITCLIQAIGFS